MTTNSKHTVMKVLRGEKADHVPHFSGMGSITLEGIRQLGYRFNEVHGDARKMADAAASTYRLFGMESVVVPFDMGVTAESLGAGMKYYEKADENQIIYPTMIRKLADSSKIEAPADLDERAANRYVMKELQQRIAEYEWNPPADPANAGRIPVVVEALQLLKKEVGEEVAIGAWVLGPFTELGQVMDLEALLKMTVKKPDVIQRHLRFMVDYLTQILRLYLEAGADFITIREMGATGSILSPRVFASLILPNLQELFGRFNDVPSVLHICGDTNAIIEMMAESGADALSVDQVNRLNETRQKVSNVPIFGNYQPFGDPLCDGEPEAVEAMIKGTIDQGADAVWPGCDIWPSVPSENMRAMLEAMKVHGPS